MRLRTGGCQHIIEDMEKPFFQSGTLWAVSQKAGPVDVAAVDSHDDLQGFGSPVTGHESAFHQILHDHLIPFHQRAPDDHFPDIRRQPLEFFREQIQVIGLDYTAQLGTVPAENML